MTQPTNPQIRTHVLLVACCAFLFFYGLGSFGLIGADEPRYAQVAREMLSRHDWITPTLQGKPWLEKPVLYYWQAMLSFRVTGVTDQSARIPAAVDASMLVAAIYFFLRRLRPGTELDGALIAASCAGIIGFARAAATDMPLAATFTIALLAWYAWYESGQSRETRRPAYFAVFYVFLALGTLAKGPVAPALAAVVILIFVALKREWRAIARTLWIPGIALYFAVTLPWYIAVQLRNPDFFRIFILEHNLARFSQDVYHHRQPFWFYMPVFLLAMMPWTLALILAVVEPARAIWSERKKAVVREKESEKNSGKDRRENGRQNSWQLFLLIWMFVPVVFFSASQSKLPGYILPAVPAGALLIAEYLASRRFGRGEGEEDERGDKRLWPQFAVAHAILCGLLIYAAFSVSSVAIYRRLPGGAFAYVGAAIAAALAIGISIVLLSRAGSRLFSRVTVLTVVVSVAVVIRTAAPIIDATQSARPVVNSIRESIQSFSREPVPVAIYHINRMQQYGLEFYLNRPTEIYEAGNIPAAAHVLVAAHNTQLEVAILVPGRRVSYLTSIPAQKLDLYWVE